MILMLKKIMLLKCLGIMLFKVDSNGSYTAFNQDNTQDESCISDLINSFHPRPIYRQLFCV